MTTPDPAAAQTAPPAAPRRPHVDTLHGDVRQDDWAWLKRKSDPAVAEYLEAENAYARAVLAPTATLQERLYQEMLGRIKQTDLSVPVRDHGWWYYTRTEEGKQYPIYARKRGSLEAPEEVTLDVNRLAEGQKFMAVGAYRVSDDGNLLAYSTDSTGFRQYTLRVKDLRTGELLPDRLEKVVSVTWAADGRTLFYTVEDHAKRSHRVLRHVLGTDPATDPVVYEEADERFGVYVGRTRSREWLVMSSGSHTTSELRVLEAARPAGEWRVVLPRKQDVEYDLDHHGDRFYLRINDTGRNFRLVSAPVADPSKGWTEVLPHRDDVMLESADFFRDHWIASERVAGLPRLRVTALRTGATHDVAFPEPVYTAGLASNPEFDTRTVRYAYQSLVTPSSVYDYDLDARQATLLKRTEVLGGYDPAAYVSERIHATASDGTRIPVSLVYRKGLRKDGSAPALLYAYGSYGASTDPTFNSGRLSLLDRGFVYAIAHIRGGGDLGKPWHDAGRMANKMNSFTDFVAAAELLVGERYTSRERLAIQGGSAGGLLVGAVTNLRPDLFKAVVAQVPFVDVINTMLDEDLPLTVGEFEEWGNPKVAEQYRWMRAYSPYDNLERKAYPAILVETSFNDSQVLYHEPAKYVARLRTLKTDANPLLLVTNMGAGHGGASGRYDRLREIARIYAFVIGQVAPEVGVVP
ncbi:MAG: S9 family peptidase [Actinomycetota bacterium]|nr:S9 family peptidase [Actinomycetota bacterium]